jgi:hypothetical protein
MPAPKAGMIKMSAPIVVSIPHRLGKEEVRRRLQSGISSCGCDARLVPGPRKRVHGVSIGSRPRELALLYNRAAFKAGLQVSSHPQREEHHESA